MGSILIIRDGQANKASDFLRFQMYHTKDRFMFTPITYGNWRMLAVWWIQPLKETGIFLIYHTQNYIFYIWWIILLLLIVVSMLCLVLSTLKLFQSFLLYWENILTIVRNVLKFCFQIYESEIDRWDLHHFIVVLEHHILKTLRL